MTKMKAKKSESGILPRTLVIAPVVKVQMQLIAADHLIKGPGKPNRNRPGAAPFARVSDTDLKRLTSESAKGIAEEYLFYTGCQMDGGCIVGMTLLTRPVQIGTARGDFTWEFDVCYSLSGPVTFAALRKEVEGIFEHWKWSGDVTYRLKMFKQQPYIDSFLGLS
jgi:hypothetical protein